MPVSVKHLRCLQKKKLPKTSLLAKWPENNLYYLVQLLNYDPKKDQCQVVYEDKTVAFSPRSELHLQFCSYKTPYASDDDIVCCLCEKETSEQPNEIIICDVCQQGYHQDCYKPRIETFIDRWSCETCQYILGPDSVEMTSSTPKKKAAPPVDESEDSDVVASDNQADASSDESQPSVQQMDDGSTLEKMQPTIINVAKALVAKEANNIDTGDFMQALSPEVKAPKVVKAAEPSKEIHQPLAIKGPKVAIPKKPKVPVIRPTNVTKKRVTPRGA